MSRMDYYRQSPRSSVMVLAHTPSGKIQSGQTASTMKSPSVARRTRPEHTNYSDLERMSCSDLRKRAEAYTSQSSRTLHAVVQSAGTLQAPPQSCLWSAARGHIRQMDQQLVVGLAQLPHSSSWTHSSEHT